MSRMDEGGQGKLWLTTEELRARLAQRREERRQATQAHIERMRAEGREPAATDGQRVIGCEVFTATARWPVAGSDELELRLKAARRDRRERFYIWGAGWPEHGVRLSAAALLGLLAENWTVIGRHYLAAGEADPVPHASTLVIDVARGVGRPDLPWFNLAIGRPEHGIGIASHHGDTGFGAEGLIVVEVLKALGDLMAERLRAIGAAASVTAHWDRVRDRVDVFPGEVHANGDLETPPDRTDAEADFYARRLGVDPAAYRLAAIWAEARRHLGEAEGADDAEDAEILDELPAGALAIPDELPDHDEVMALAATVAEAYHDDPAEFVRRAVSQRNVETRAQLFYIGWPEQSPPAQS